MFETVPFLWKCNIFDGRYFIWKTDQCRLFTCATCIAACLFADTEKYTRRSGMSTFAYRREIEKQVWSRLYLMKMMWRIKKNDWSRAVTWSENKSSCLPPDVVSPCRVSRHCAAAARAMTHSTCFARHVSLTENERPKYAKLRFNACFLDNKFSFSFRYNKQLIAQLVGRHEDLFNPENSVYCYNNFVIKAKSVENA